MIVFAVLLTVLALPAAIVIWFRALDKTSSRWGRSRSRRSALRWCSRSIIARGVFADHHRPDQCADRAHARRSGAAAGRRSSRAGSAGHARDRGAQPELSRSRRAAGGAHRICLLVRRACLARTQVAADLDPRLGRAAARCGDVGRGPPAVPRRTSSPIATGWRRLLERLRDLARADIPLDAKGVALGQAAEQLQLGHPTLTIVGQRRDGDADRALDGGRCHHPRAPGRQFAAARRDALSIAGSPRRQRCCASSSPMMAGAFRRATAAKVFEPFFTTRRETGGTGMGLQIVRSMLEAHGGRIALLPSEAGASFELIVPLLPTP